MTPRSLRGRLLLSLLAVTALAGAAALVDTRAEARRTAQAVSDRVLAGAALAIAERVTVSETGGLDVEVPFSALDMLSSTAEDRVFYRIDGPGGFLTGYETLAPIGADSGGVRFADTTVQDAAVRAVTLRRSLSTAEGTLGFAVTVAETTRARDELGQAILFRSAVRLSILAAVAALISWAVVTLALRPLDRMGGGLARRTPGDLTPLAADGVPQEVEPFVTALNGFVGRLGQSVEALRRFTSNASHQIRTPLAVARTHLALASRSPSEGAASLAKAEAALVRAERVLAQLLLLARIDANREPRLEPVDLAAMARAVTTEALEGADRAGQDLGFDGPPRAMVRADPVLLPEAIRNLVDNAQNHAGPGAVVTVRVTDGPDATRLSVIDDGPGLPPDQIAALLSGEARAPAGAVHGLGFDIVRDIAALCGAGLSAGPAGAGRGLAVTLTFAQIGDG